MSPSSVTLRPSTWSRSTSISEAKPSRLGTEGRKTEAVSPRLRARTKRPTAWAKNSGVEVRVAQTPTASRGTSTPSETIRTATIQRSSDSENFGDLLRRQLLVGEHHRGRLAADPAQDLGVGARALLVRGDHQPTGVRHVPAHLGEPGVGRLQHRRHPRAVGSSAVRSAWACMSLVSGSPEPGGDLVAHPGAPLHLARVGHEEHRADHVVGQRLGVAVGVVGGRAGDAVRTGLVGDERDRVHVGAERRTGQRQAAGGGVEGLPHPLAPGQCVAGVVHLVEDHQGLEPLGADPHRQRVDRHPGVGDRDPEVVLGGAALAGRVRRVDRDARPLRGLGPLDLEVLGRGHDRHPVDDPPAEQLGGDGERERRLAGPRGRHREEVARAAPRSTSSWRPPATRAGIPRCPTRHAPAKPGRAQE